MKYIIYYTLPDEIYSKMWGAKDEKQLVRFLKMLTKWKSIQFLSGGNKMNKNYKLSYEILFTSESEPSRYTVEFIYFETLVEFIKNTAKHQNLISFNMERNY